MKSAIESLNRKIRESGYRMTKQRAVVLEELSKTNDHPRADEIYQRVRRRLPNISFGTVYRNLKTLKELGLVRELNYGKKFSRFEVNIGKHHHFICLGCGRVYDLDIVPSRKLCEEAAQKTGFEVADCRVEFYGYCDAKEKRNLSDTEIDE